MSVEAFAYVLNEAAISGNAKVILLGMANHAHPDGTNAYPSMATLAKYAAVNRRTAQRNVRQLELDGWIQREGVGPVGQTRWRVVMNGRPGGAAYCRGGAASDTPGGRHQRSGGAAPAPPEPTLTNTEEESATHSLVDPSIRDLECRAIFDAWVTATGRDQAKTKPSPARRKMIDAAVDEYDLDDCLAAVTNIGRDSWAMGDNERGRPFNDLAHALGSGPANRAERIEKWRDWQPPPAGARNGNGQPRKGSLAEAEADQADRVAQHARLLAIEEQEHHDAQ